MSPATCYQRTASGHTMTVHAPRPGELDPAQTRRKRDPGRCFRRAGWRHAGFTAGGLYMLQHIPAAVPAPALVPGAQPALSTWEEMA